MASVRVDGAKASNPSESAMNVPPGESATFAVTVTLTFVHAVKSCGLAMRFVM